MLTFAFRKECRFTLVGKLKQILLSKEDFKKLGQDVANMWFTNGYNRPNKYM